MLVVALVVFGGDSGGGACCSGGGMHGGRCAQLTGLTHKDCGCSRDSVGKDAVINYPRITLAKI